MKRLRVYKYLIATDMLLPVGAKLVMADTQNGRDYTWFEVDTMAPHEKRQFDVVGTGDNWDNDAWEHRWTWMAGPFVWHLIEKVK